MKGTINGEPFDFDLESVRFDEAEAIERALGYSYMKWTKMLQEGSVTAIRALVWLIKRRDQPGLRIDDESIGSIPLTAFVPDEEPEPADVPVDPTEAATPS